MPALPYMAWLGCLAASCDFQQWLKLARAANTLFYVTFCAPTSCSTAHTTVSLNAVVVAVKDNVATKKKPASNDNMSCGFLEKDKMEEHDAALSSPIKGKKWLTNAVSHTPCCLTVLTTH